LSEAVTLARLGAMVLRLKGDADRSPLLVAQLLASAKVSRAGKVVQVHARLPCKAPES
jgi:hypothetical protein